MDVLTFISSIVKSLSWPAFAIFATIYFRVHAKTLALFIRKIGFKGVEIELRDEFDTARGIAEQVQIELPQSDSDLTGLAAAAKVFDELALRRPDMAIIDIWRDLEMETHTLSRHLGYDNPRTTKGVIEFLYSKDILTTADRKLFEQLRDIRNASIHSRMTRDITPGQVADFAEFAAILKQRMRRLRQEHASIDTTNAPVELG